MAWPTGKERILKLISESEMSQVQADAEGAQAFLDAAKGIWRVRCWWPAPTPKVPTRCSTTRHARA
jgi:hypothetical protein